MSDKPISEESFTKAIFLDIDGPICPPRVCIAVGDRGVFSAFDMAALRFFEDLLREDPDLGIVISSTWRLGQKKDFFYHLFGAFGLPNLKKRFFNDWKTKGLIGKRGVEVKEWLDRHPEVTNYVIVDDSSDFLEEQKSKLVLVDVLDGILHGHYRQIKHVLYPPEVDPDSDPTDCQGIILTLEDIKEGK